MLTLNFQDQFVQAVENGLAEMRGDPHPWPGVRPKFQTIRAYRKDGKDPKPGDWRALYTGMRQPPLPDGTPRCRKLGEVECTSVDSLYIDDVSPNFVHLIESGQIAEGDLDTFAHSDGFRDYAEMRDWFEQTHGLPFEGLLIRWGKG